MSVCLYTLSSFEFISIYSKFFYYTIFDTQLLVMRSNVVMDFSGCNETQTPGEPLSTVKNNCLI